MTEQKKTQKKTQTQTKICQDCQQPFIVEPGKEWAWRCLPCWRRFNEKQGQRVVSALQQENLLLRQQLMEAEVKADIPPPHESQRLRQLEREIASLNSRLECSERLREIERVIHAHKNLQQKAAIPAEIHKRLVMLCHPDKHGSEMSTRVTQWLLENRP